MRCKYFFGVGFFGLFPCLLAQQDANTTPSSVFILPVGNNLGNYTFALNVPENSNDVYFHLSAPASFSWIAVGTGSEMKDSLMFVMYSNALGNGVTISPRLCSGYSEPVFSSALDVVTFPSTGLSDNMMTVNARCANCQTSMTGSLNLTSTAQPWIYALGPNSVNSVNLKSDSMTAGIERHSIYGRFTMDMLRATGGSGSPPTSYAAAAGSAEVGNPSTDSNWASIIHAVATTAAFVLLMPAGIIFLRVLPENVRWHWINQSLALGLAVVGGGIGIYLSSMFNKSKSYNSSHQILGLLAIGFMFVQWILGFWHHHLYRKTQQTSRYGPIHRWFGRGVMVLAIVTGGIGLTWSYASTRVVIGYVIAVVVLMVAVIVSLVWKKSVSRSWTITRGTNRKFGRSFSDSGVHLTEYADLSRERSS